ncbi:GNAT family N-acetyltransferase [Limosilactobacillus fermentum]|uniref:GNAT family N-acetyltransferase n=1 Tax=Limosilactobacillus fermentum TaxID=1613 RepID=UPI0021CB1749|nr:GNAT family N-acetyltransferase [Limosilactobacillus fermentum]MDR7663013.1 GNAT family N-acetyltransferase [Limosilactobacillus fermentum]MDU4240512.1 GNAT family N-acetyltransferase [Limosilactobacillus fermentum]WLF75211.1 GNAT family N-acetyltransferase [Limosilactobacillus fermentum]
MRSFCVICVTKFVQVISCNLPIQNNTQPVGMVWLAQYHENSDKAFIYDIQIYPDFQNQGFGTQALKLIATQAKALGFKSLGLHVFGHNKRAIHVYEKSGF